MKTKPEIRTKRLLLRKIRDYDLDHVFSGLSHPDVTKYYGVRFESLEATREQMSWFAHLEKDGTGIWFAICLAENGQFIGAGGFNNLSKQHRKAEVGLWLLPDYWGKGYMQEAMPAICDYGFSQLNLHRIEGFVETENTASKRALDKLGFTHEGTMKDCEMKDGKFISLDVYAIFEQKP